MNELQKSLVDAIRTVNSSLARRDLAPALDFYTQGFDSLDHIQILMKIEDLFGVTFDDTDFDDCNSVDSIAAFLIRSRVDMPATAQDQVRLAS